MLVILKKPSEDYEEAFKCNNITIARDTERNENGSEICKCLALRFLLKETKYDKDEIYNQIPADYFEKSTGVVELKNRHILLDIKMQDPYDDVTLIEILKRLNEYDDVDKVVIEDNGNNVITIMLYPGLLSYMFHLVGVIDAL